MTWLPGHSKPQTSLLFDESPRGKVTGAAFFAKGALGGLCGMPPRRGPRLVFPLHFRRGGAGGEGVSMRSLFRDAPVNQDCKTAPGGFQESRKEWLDDTFLA